MSSPFEERMDAALEEQAPVEEEIAAPLRGDIVSLINLGRIEESFSLYGHDFTIRTLNMDEELLVDQLLTEKFSSTWNEKAYKTAVVSASISVFDGLPFVTPLGADESTFARAYSKVKRWYRPVIFTLYDRCEGLEQRQQEALNELEKKEERAMPVASSGLLENRDDSPEP